VAYTFDGPNKLVVLTSGTTEFDVQDLYSRWVDWIASSDNSKYLPAMRAVGGDPISATKNLGATFFMTNGWRVRPQEADHRLTVNGNLYTDPSGFSPFVGTVGAFNIVIELQVSSLVDSALAQMPEIEQSVFEGGVTIDATLGQAGTAYPLGTPRYPVNNLADAKVIAGVRGFSTLFVRGTLTIGATDSINDYHIAGQGATLNIYRTVIVLTNGCTTSGATISDARVTGRQNGEVRYERCYLDDIDNVHCTFRECSLAPTGASGWTIRNNASIPFHQAEFRFCNTGAGAATIDRNGSSVFLVISDFDGALIIKNQNRSIPSGGAAVGIVIDTSGGSVTVDSSCTTGWIAITGYGKLVNNSGGTTVDTSAFNLGAAGGGSVPTSAENANAVWSDPRALTTGKFIALKG
jgi:hypothetical protein